jgi:hypothetical protein
MATKKKAAKKAAPKKAAVKKAATLSQPKLLTENEAPEKGFTIDAEFKMGKGSLIAILSRKGKKIDEQTIEKTSSINFDAQRGDSIALDGSCSGTATIKINQDTDPKAPFKFNK